MAIDLKSLIDINLLAYFKTKLDLILANKVDKVDGKGLSTNDYTTDEKTKLAGIATGAQVNVLEGIQINGATVNPTNKIANIAMPTKTSDLTNDSGFITATDVYTKSEVDQKLVGAMNYKGTKATTADLPKTGNTQGDVWHVNADGSEWAWNGSSWDELGSSVDLSGYVEDDDLGLATTADIDTMFS